MKVLFTGGSGMLGTAMKKIAPDWSYPTHAELGVSCYVQVLPFIRDGGFDVVVHAAAFISPPKVEANPAMAVNTNILGTVNVVDACFYLGGKIRIVYVSTDYVFDGERGLYKEDDPVHPTSKYAWSKLGGECAVRCYDNSLIVRTSFGADEFPYPKAYDDQWTSRLTVSNFAALLKGLALNTSVKGVMHVGSSQPMTVLDFARTISPDKNVEPMSRKDVRWFVPRNTSLDTSRFWQLMDGETKIPGA